MTAPNDNTPVSIIQDAYMDSGLVPEGQTVNSDQIVIGMRKLTDLINIWQTQGIKLWLNQDLPIPLISGQGTYLLGPAGLIIPVRPPRIIDAWYADLNLIRRPLVPLAWTDWVRLSQTTVLGQLNSYFVEKDQTDLKVHFWLVPDSIAATGQAHLLSQYQVTNFTNCTETMNFPIEWRIALRWGLADELATGQPQAIMDRCQSRALMYRTMLEDWDVEDVPVRFTQDTQGHQSSGRFQ